MKTAILSCALLLSMLNSQAGNGSDGHTSTGRKNTPAVRNILSTKLPARLLTPIRTKYKDYWITDLHRAVADGKVSYYITLENADQQLKLNTSHSSNWQVTHVFPKIY
jgi:hypothetical protein